MKDELYEIALELERYATEYFCGTAVDDLRKFVDRIKDVAKKINETDQA